MVPACTLGTGTPRRPARSRPACPILEAAGGLPAWPDRCEPGRRWPDRSAPHPTSAHLQPITAVTTARSCFRSSTTTTASPRPYNLNDPQHRAARTNRTRPCPSRLPRRHRQTNEATSVSDSRNRPLPFNRNERADPDQAADLTPSPLIPRSRPPSPSTWYPPGARLVQPGPRLATAGQSATDWTHAAPGPRPRRRSAAPVQLAEPTQAGRGCVLWGWLPGPLQASRGTGRAASANRAAGGSTCRMAPGPGGRHAPIWSSGSWPSRGRLCPVASGGRRRGHLPGPPGRVEGPSGGGIDRKLVWGTMPD